MLEPVLFWRSSWLCPYRDVWVMSTEVMAVTTMVDITTAAPTSIFSAAVGTAEVAMFMLIASGEPRAAGRRMQAVPVVVVDTAVADTEATGEWYGSLHST